MSAVVINLRVGGVAEAQSALRSVEQEVVRMQRQQTRAAQAGAKERSGALNSEQKAQQAAWKAATKEAEGFEKQKLRIRETSVQYASKLAMKQADAEIKAAERSARETVRAADRAERDKTRDVEREAKARARAAAQEASEQRRVTTAFRRDALGRVGGTLRTAATGAAGALTFAGTLAAGDAIRDRIAERRSYTAVSNAAYVPEVKDAHGKIVQEQIARPGSQAVSDAVAPVAIATNMKRGDLAKGLQDYVERSSDFKGGAANLMTFAKIAKSQGADFSDVTKAAGTIKAQNKGMSDDDMIKTLYNVIGQGKLGNVPLSDLAVSAGKVTASRGMYSGDQTENQRKLLGLAQLAAPSAGSTEEAATTVTDYSQDLLKHNKAISHALGHSITDKSGMLNDPGQIAAEMLDKTHGNLSGIQDMGMGQRSIKLFEELAPIYQKAEAAKKGSGKDAVLGATATYEGASYTADDVEKDFAAVMSDAGEKLDGAVERIKGALADGLEPSLDKLVSELPQLVPKVVALAEAMGSVADTMLSSPFLTMGAIITAVILKDIAAAQIASTIQKLISGAGSGGGAIGGVGGNLVAGLAIGGAAVGVTTAGIVAIDASEDAHDKLVKGAAGNAASDVSMAANLSRAAQNGTATPAAVQAAQAEVERLQEQKKQLMKGPSAVEQAMGAAASLVDGGEAARTREDARLTQLRDTEKSLRDLQKAAADASAAMSGVRPHPDSPDRVVPMTGRH